MYPNPSEVARGGARLWTTRGECHFLAREFMVALSGGNTPRMLFEYLASERVRGQVDWAKFPYSGARWRDPESNYGMARREFDSRPIPQHNVHRMEAEESPISARRRMSMRKFSGNIWSWMIVRLFPRFDLNTVPMVTPRPFSQTRA